MSNDSSRPDAAKRFFFPALKVRAPRLWGWILISIVLLLVVAWVAPQQVPVSIYKLSLVTMAGVVGYWLDRSMFPYARPDVFLTMGEPFDVDFVGPSGDLKCDPEVGLCTLQSAPDTALLQLAGQSMFRRAVIVAAAMLAMGLGA